VQKAKDAKPDVLFIFVPGGTQATAMIKAIKDLGLRESRHQTSSRPRTWCPTRKLPNMGDAPGRPLVTAGNYSTAANRPRQYRLPRRLGPREYGPKIDRRLLCGPAAGTAMAAVFDIIKQSKGQSSTGDEAMRRAQGLEESRQPRADRFRSIPRTRDIVQNIYMRRTEMKDGQARQHRIRDNPERQGSVGRN